MQQSQPQYHQESPMTTTRMAPHFNTCFVKCLPRPATIEPNPSISGMVPSAKKNIDSAPVNGLAEANATICIDCRGPQGIRPLNKPMIKGVLRLWEAFFACLFENVAEEFAGENGAVLEKDRAC